MLLISTDISSNTVTFGVTSSEVRQPNLITGLNYVFEKGFDLGYTNILTANSDTTFSKVTTEHDFSIGYIIEINDKWSIYPSYIHMFHSKRSFTLASNFSDIVQSDISYFGNNYYGSLTMSYLNGDRDMFFLSLQNAVGLNFKNFISAESLLNIQFGVYINYSDKNYYNKYLFNELNTVTYINWVENNFSYLFYRRILNSVNGVGFDATKELFNEQIISSKPEIFDPNYKITSMDFYIPVYYSLDKLMFNMSTVLNIPITVNPFYENQNSFYISFGINYSFLL